MVYGIFFEDAPFGASSEIFGKEADVLGIWVENMTLEERKALVTSFLGKTVKIRIDRPIGYIHEKERYTLTYPINYGYIPEVYGGDGEELDVYLLGVDIPVEEYTAEVVGIVYREDDVEDKLIAVPVGMKLTREQMEAEVEFQEQYHKSRVETEK